MGSPAEWRRASPMRPTLISAAPSPIWPPITHAGVRRRAGQSRAFPFRSPPAGGVCLRRRNRKKEFILMALPEFSMRQLLEAGAHFGHQTHRWNPKMERYIFGSRANIHIIDLSQTMPAAAPGAGQGARSRRLRRPGAVRRHQAPGVRAGGGGRQALRAVLRQPPLARRHAHQLAHHLRLDRAPARTGRRARTAARRRPHRRRSCCSSPASATSWSCRWAASRTWAASPT